MSQVAGKPVLESVSYHVIWEGPTLVADQVPNIASPHGIYAQKKLEDGYKSCSVWGEVALSGIVVEGTNGYRAERATIRKLRLRYFPGATPTHWLEFGGSPLTWRHRAWEVAEQLAERYQCEVELDWLPQSALPAEYVIA